MNANKVLLVCLAILLVASHCVRKSAKARLVDTSLEFNQIPDSIRLQAESHRDVVAEANYLLEKCRQFCENHPSLTAALASRVERLLRKTDHTFEYAKALYWQSWVVNEQQPESVALRSAAVDLNICKEIFQKKQAHIWLVRSLNLLAFVHYNLYEESTGKSYNEVAIQVLQEQKLDDQAQPEEWGNIYRVQGNIELYTSRRIDTVLAYFDKSHRCYTQLSTPYLLARLLMNYAIVYDMRDEVQKSDSIFQKAFAMYQELGQTERLSEAYLNYATFQANRFKDTKETKWLEISNLWLNKALSLQPENSAEIYFQYGANYHNLAIYREKKVYYDSAALLYQRVLSIGVAEKNTEYLKMVATELSKICPELEEDICTQIFTETTDAYQNISDTTSHILKHAAWVMEQFQREEAKRERRQILLGGLLVIFILLTIFFVTGQRSKIKLLRTRMELLRTRMEALRSQMNPHFISNSLNAIDSLVNQNRNEEASEYIIDFSRLCRLVLANSKKKWISLQVELETIGYYLSLEKLRMKNKLTYELKVGEYLDQKKIMVPPMLLQPFIENAIIHGIQNKHSPGKLLISIAQLDHNLLECHIEDDGVGRNKARALRQESILEHVSYGIHITQERIDSAQQMEGSSIQIIDLYDPAGVASGTRVVLKIPITHQSNKV
ncbi:MAG: histidine kinase [Bacteroidota bacterium]